MSKVEQDSGISYGRARAEHDDIVGAGYDGRGEGTGAVAGQANPDYDAYQQAGSQVEDKSKYDSVSAAYMENGPSIKHIPWSGSEEAEMDAFVSEGSSPIPSLQIRHSNHQQNSTSTPNSSSPTTAS
jgi:phospholipase D1/2